MIGQKPIGWLVAISLLVVLYFLLTIIDIKVSLKYEVDHGHIGTVVNVNQREIEELEQKLIQREQLMKRNLFISAGCYFTF